MISKIRFMQAGRMGMAMGMLVIALSICGVAGAQSDPSAPPPGPPPHRGGPGPGGFRDDAMGFIGFEGGLGGKTVTGAPVTATFTTQTSETLGDGNKIKHNTSGTFTRNGAGSTRQDVTLPAIGPWATSGQTPPHVVLIHDVTANVLYTLDPDKLTARQFVPPNWRNGSNGGPAGQANGGTGPGFGRKNSSDTVTSSLGTQTQDGLLLQGTRTTRTVPAGAIGNDNPIQITVDRWYSPDLQMNVIIKRTDPRTGETVFQLTNIQRQEPDPSLFQVPSSYTIQQDGPGGGRGRRGKGPGQPPPPPQN